MKYRSSGRLLTALALVLAASSGCGYNSGIVRNSVNHVTLSQPNFRFVARGVEASETVHSLFCAIPFGSSPYSDAMRTLNTSAELQPNQALINLREDSATRFYGMWCTTEVTVSGDVIEFGIADAGQFIKKQEPRTAPAPMPRRKQNKAAMRALARRTQRTLDVVNDVLSSEPQEAQVELGVASVGTARPRAKAAKVAKAAPVRAIASPRQSIITTQPESESAEPFVLGARVGVLTRSRARKLGLRRPRGVVVTGVRAQGAAVRLGLRQDDIIVRVNGNLVRNVRSFGSELGKLSFDSDVVFKVWRDRAVTTLSSTASTTSRRPILSVN